MGFWNKLGEVSYKTAKFLGNTATVVSNSIEQKAGELKELKQEYEQKSDEELLQIIKSKGFTGSTESEKGVARKVLRERGYMSGSE
jgi:predicted transcriptional regulator